MAKQETVDFVRSRFEEQEARHDYTNPAAVAQAITGIPESPLNSRLVRAVLRMPTAREHVYPGTEETLRHLLGNGDEVIIWTQGYEKGQLWKVAQTGLYSLRRELPRIERDRFRVFAAIGKVNPLPNLFEQLTESGNNQIVIVDDKSKNIVSVDKQIKEWKQGGAIPDSLDIQLVWINQGRTKDQVPNGYTIESFKEQFQTIEDIRELQPLRNTMQGKVGWLIDCDHTILHTAAAKEDMFVLMAGDIEKMHVPVIAPHIDLQLGLNGNVRQATQLLSGMSGGQVLKVVTDSDAFVVKHNPNAPEKVTREIDGYRMLRNTPLSSHLLPPVLASKRDAVLAIPFFPGIQLREGLKTDSLQKDTALSTIASLLSIKKEWWSKQSKVLPNGDLLSMQRDEWNDTLARTQDTLKKLALQFNIPIQDLWRAPIVHKGEKHASLLSIMARVSETLSARPPYAVLVHGDATGANILVDPQEKTWKLVDAEWVGHGDPAEAFVRMIKYESTTTAKPNYRVGAWIEGGELHIDYSVPFSDTARSLQQHGLSKTRYFARALADPEFPLRVQTYLAGSYLRELALALQRGYPELGLFAMTKAAEAIHR